MHQIRRTLALLFTLSALISASALTATPAAAATGCVRLIASNFDAPGNDNYAASLNGEWVRIKNVCATGKGIGGWKIHDYNKNHTYRFPSDFRIGAGKTVTLYSGKGSQTTSKRYFGYSYGAVWNNDPPEWAYLRKPDGTLMSKWTEY